MRSPDDPVLVVPWSVPVRRRSWDLRLERRFIDLRERPLRDRVRSPRPSSIPPLLQRPPLRSTPPAPPSTPPSVMPGGWPRRTVMRCSSCWRQTIWNSTTHSPSELERPRPRPSAACRLLLLHRPPLARPLPLRLLPPAPAPAVERLTRQRRPRSTTRFALLDCTHPPRASSTSPDPPGRIRLHASTSKPLGLRRRPRRGRNWASALDAVVLLFRSKDLVPTT